MKIIAMIPARMGSKRIPLKNIRLLGDRALIEYPVDLSKGCQLFDEIWVNTESEALGEFCKKRGICFHKRPSDLSNDTATNRDFTYEFLKQHDCDYVVMVNPTSPLISTDTLNKFVRYVLDNDFDTILSVVSEKTECFFKKMPINFNSGEKINSQMLEPVDRVVWSITAWKKESFIRNEDTGINPVFGGKIGLFQIPKHESCDIDTEEDWIIAEYAISNKRSFEKKYLTL